MMMSRKCYTCKEEKPLEEFYRSKNEKYGRHGRCITCVKTRYLSDSAKESKKVYNRARSRRSGTGFTPEEFEQKFEEQGSRCAICGTDKPTGKWKVFAVDHNHETGQVRELLCNECNRGIGLLKDNPDLLMKAAEYLFKHNIKTQNEKNER